jgi:hypothetical protein
VWGYALVALAAVAAPTQAAWNNVFQVCCHSCGGHAAPVVAQYDPGCPQPCPQPCPQQVCTTRYVQRCYYQPVTTYRQSCYYEPVTTYRTSYYYEPVTSYRYSCYFDPCTCSYQQVATPCTSYRLRSQCCPVTSYLQRCCMQPVTSYQQVTMYEPVTTCCTTTTGAPVAALPPGAVATPAAPPPSTAPAAAAPSAAPVVPANPPGTSEDIIPSNPPRASEGSSTKSDFRRYPRETTEPPPRMPPADTGTSRQPQLRAPIPAPPPAAPSASVPLDRVASRVKQLVDGQLVRADRSPRANTKVVFIGRDPGAIKRTVQTDADGHFEVPLTDGTWLVYVDDAAGRPVFQQTVQIRDGGPALLKLVSR